MIFWNKENIIVMKNVSLPVKCFLSDDSLGWIFFSNMLLLHSTSKLKSKANFRIFTTLDIFSYPEQPGERVGGILSLLLVFPNEFLNRVVN